MKIKYKVYTSIILIVLLVVSLNLNSFAVSSFFSFSNSSVTAECIYNDGSNTDISNKITKTVQSIDNLNYTYFVSIFFPTKSVKRYILTLNVDLDLYTNTEYDFSFKMKSDYSMADSNTISLSILCLSNNEQYSVISLTDVVSLTQSPVEYSGVFTTPSMSGQVKYVIQALVITSGRTGFGFYISDILLTPSGPLYGQSMETPDTSELDDVMGQYDDIVNQLPQINKDDMNKLFNFDFTEFNLGMASVRIMFDRILTTVSFNSVLVFALSIGLATYIIGRRLH